MNKSVKIFLYESFKHPGYWEGLIHMDNSFKISDEKVLVTARSKEMAEYLAFQKYSEMLKEKMEKEKVAG